MFILGLFLIMFAAASLAIELNKTAAIFLILGLGSLYLGVNGIDYVIGKGSHTGIVTAIDTKGLFVKSTSVYVKTSQQSSQEDRYCVIDSNVMNKLNLAQVTSSKVSISYIQKFDAGLACRGNDQIITGVTPAIQ